MAPSSAELGPMLRQLHVLLAAAVPLDRTLRALQHGNWTHNLMHWRASIQKGHPLSKAMAGEPGPLGSFHVQLVRLGEKFGQLDECVGYLADLEEKRHALSHRLRAAFTYPLILLVMVLAVVFFLPPIFLPGILKLLANHGSLPWPTKVVLMWSTLLRQPWFYLVAVGAGLLGAWGVRRLRKRGLGRAWNGLDRAPQIGPLLRSLATLRFTLALSAGCRAGATLLEALRLAGPSSGHPLLEQKIPVIEGALFNGRNLTQALAAARFFPRSFLIWIEVGMESGTLVSSLEAAAKFLELELETRIESFVLLLEPLSLALLGFISGFVIIATALPLAQMVRAL